MIENLTSNKQKLINFFLITALIPATIYMILAILSMVSLSVFYGGIIPLIMYLAISLSGYMGLLRLLFWKKTRKNDLINLIFLLVGLIGFVLIVNSGGKQSWYWLFSFKNPFKWLLFIYPVLIGLIFTFILGFKFIKSCFGQ